MAQLCSRSWPVRYFTEPSLLYLAGTAVGEVGDYKMVDEVRNIVVSATVMDDVEAHKIARRASINVIGWHGYGRFRGP